MVVNKHNSLLGWVPSEDQYVLIQNTKPPSTDEILRRVSHEPETGLTNLPLSIYNLIHWADEIGATDTVLLSMITCYLKKYKSHILDILDTKKQSLTAIIEILSFHCSTEHEKTAVLQKLKNLKGTKMRHLHQQPLGLSRCTSFTYNLRHLHLLTIYG